MKLKALSVPLIIISTNVSAASLVIFGPAAHTVYNTSPTKGLIESPEAKFISEQKPERRKSSNITNHTYGIGLETSNRYGTIGVMSYSNSHDNHSNAIYGSFRIKKFTRNLELKGSVAAVTGYDKDISTIPSFSVQYKNFRYVTTMPFGNIMNQKYDAHNIQFIINF